MQPTTLVLTDVVSVDPIIGAHLTDEQDYESWTANDRDQESSDLFDCAGSIIADCKAEVSLANLDNAIFLFREVLNRRPSSHPLRTDAEGDLAAAISMRILYDSKHTDIAEWIRLRGDGIVPILDGLRGRAGPKNFNYTFQTSDDGEILGLAELAKSILSDFRASVELSSLSTAVLLFQKALELRPRLHSKRMQSLLSLADALCKRFCHSRIISDLDIAVSYLREAIELCPGRGFRYATLLDQLCSVLGARFDSSGNLFDLQEILLLHLSARRAEESTTSPLLYACQLQEQFKQSADLRGLDTAIALMREGIKELPAGSDIYNSAINSFTEALNTRFKNGGQQQDLDEAISVYRQALELQSLPLGDEYPFLANLGCSLIERFMHTAQRRDLEEAVPLLRQAIHLYPSHWQRPNFLDNLANALNMTFTQDGRQEDLEEAVFLYRQALELRSPTDPGRWRTLNNLAAAVTKTREGESLCRDLDEVIELCREALAIQSPSDSYRSVCLNSLANALFLRSQHYAQRGDLDDSILLYRQAVELLPPSHPGRAYSLQGLAAVLSHRFELDRQREDLDEAISTHRQGLKLLSESHIHRPYSLHYLAIALTSRFQQDGRIEDLNEAILLHRQALDLVSPSDPDRARSLTYLGNALGERYGHEGGSKDLNEAITLHEQCYELWPVSHPDKFQALSNLASILTRKFEKEGSRQDLDRSISLHMEALNHIGAEKPARAKISSNIGRMYLSAYSRFPQDTEYLENAMSYFRATVECLSAPVTMRFRTANMWAHQADINQHPSALQGYDTAISLLPALATLDLNVYSRQQAITGSNGLAMDAAICAIRAGHADRAVELLEAGRAVFWSQSMQLRTPMDDLHDVAPALATKLRQIAAILEKSSYQEKLIGLHDNHMKLRAEKEASRLKQVSADWFKTLEEVRQLEGFEDFLQPRRLSALQTVAEQGPVIFLMANKSESYALIMTSSAVQHITVPTLALIELYKLTYLIQWASKATSNFFAASTSSPSIETIITHTPILSSTRRLLERCTGEDRAGRPAPHSREICPDDIFRIVLTVLWDEIVKPVIASLNIHASDEPSLVRWCPTGPFTFLPIHAAGRYSNTSDSECASDYIISSYTPTVSALIPHKTKPSTESLKMMVVIESETLPATLQELRAIEERVPSQCLVKLGTTDTPASVDEVISHLAAVSIAHFACHGVQNRSKPLDSALILQNGRLRISAIMQQPMPNASLAFLCACETAMGDEKLPDEAISIGAAILFSGFPSVVATMWSIADTDGPAVADAFYKELFQSHVAVDRGLDISRSAQALHNAIKKLRLKNIPFVRWVPFIHIGR